VVATLLAPFVRNHRWVSVSARHIFLVRPPYKADAAREEWAGSRVAEYRRLGRTEARVSDISLGSGSSTGGRQRPEVVREAIERGINYFDTAPDYSEAGSEKRFGQAMKGVRDRMFLATKFCTPRGHLAPGSPVEAYMEAVNGSLRRLQTDWVDLVHIHSCDSVERLLDENAHEAFDRLREQGKVRFLGVSTHTPDLELVANAAIDSGRFDVMMLAYHFGAWPGLGAIIERAAAQDIGVVAMKTLRGAKHQGLEWSRAERDSFTQASFKWVLSNPAVACLVISLWESAQLDEFLFASGKRPDAEDLALLQRYGELVAGTHCRPHCGACLARCPEGVPIHHVLRHRMYFEDFGAEKEAMRLYAQLDVRANACRRCDAPCANACPDGIPIPERTREAHELLTLA
jgi:predicted aldo/keto reductase-like oxidoreductase